MQVHVRLLQGNWNLGYALDKHTVRSIYLGDNEYGRAQFDTQRSEAGEALFRLKYRSDLNQVQPLAQALSEHICPLIPEPGAIIPMPASTERPFQPVTVVARTLGQIMKTPVVENVLHKAQGGPKLKDVACRADKVQALEGKFFTVDNLPYNGARPVLLLDDLFDSGATAEAATTALLRYPKVSSVLLVTLTSKV